MNCTRDGDRQHDDRMARIDAGEECYQCGSADVKQATSGPQYRVPLFECRLCGCLWFDAFTQPTVDAWTLPLFPDRAP